MQTYTVEFNELTETSRERYHDSFFGRGYLKEHWKNASGTTERPFGPAVTIREIDTNAIAAEIWYSNGVIHRADGPAIMIDQSGNPSFSIWYRNGRPHRENAPYLIGYSRERSGFAVTEGWAIDGRNHRIGGPSLSLICDKTGTVQYETWSSHGKLHRVEGPAVLYRDERTQIVYDEEWYQNGLIHRLTGPAVITRSPKTGEVATTGYYINDVEYADREFGERVRNGGAKRQGGFDLPTP